MALGCLSLGFLFFIFLVILRFIFPDLYFWKPIKLSLNGVRCLDIEDESQYFYDSSEFKMPTNAEIVISCNDHSGFHRDGEYYVVFDTTNQYINNYLQSRLWEISWKRGPIPDTVTSKTGLYKKFLEDFQSPNVWYLVEDRFPVKESQPANIFHNGRLIMINPDKKRVFYSQWDF